VYGVWIAAGGALGAVARFVIGGWATTAAWAGFPWGTFAVNVSGSTLLGLVYGLTTGNAAHTRTRAFLAIGFCGGFTTFSTFDLETYSLLRRGEIVTAALYSTGSVVTCVAGVLVGLAAGLLLIAQRPAHRRRAGAQH
jgi:fluoride exporter